MNKKKIAVTGILAALVAASFIFDFGRFLTHEALKANRAALRLYYEDHSFRAVGHSKQRMVRIILQEGNPDRLPAGLVRPAAGICTWFPDEDAAASLSRGRHS